MLLRKKSSKRQQPNLNKKLDRLKPKTENISHKSPLFTKLTLATTLTLAFFLLPNSCNQGKIPKNQSIKNDTTYVNEITPEPASSLPPKK